MITWNGITEKARSEGVSPFLILKEFLHLLILDFLFREGAFSFLVFQGGTALRIAYQGVRYSEDLDFVLSQAPDPASFDVLSKMLQGLPSYLDKFLPFAKKAALRTQRETKGFIRFYLVLKIENSGVQDRTNLEVADIPSHQSETMIVRKDGLPLSPAIRVETPKEILADKFCAFGSRAYVKGRDLWDIHFLLHDMKVPFDPEVKELVHKKVTDYHSTPAAFQRGFQKNLSTLDEKGEAIFKMEMDRFLPLAYQSAFRGKYPEILRTVRETLKNFLAGFAK